MWSESPTLNTNPVNLTSEELITSEEYIDDSTYTNHDTHHHVVNGTSIEQEIMMLPHHSTINSSNNNRIEASHIFLYSRDYSLFRRTERLIWHLNHLHTNINLQIQKDNFSSHTFSQQKNVKVISSSSRKFSSLKRNRFLKLSDELISDNESGVNGVDTNNSPTESYLSEDSSIISNNSSYISTSNNNSTRINRSSSFYQPHKYNNRSTSGVSNSFNRKVAYNSPVTNENENNYNITRSVSMVDQLNQSTSNNITRSVSIDQIHHPVVGIILPPMHTSTTMTSIHGVEENTGDNENETLSTTSNASSHLLIDESQLAMELLPSTFVHTVYSKYNIVITIDISSSMVAIDPSTGEVLFDRIYDIYANILRRLTEPITIPKYDGEIIPELHLTGIAIGMVGKPIHTMFQDFSITCDNIDESLYKIKRFIVETEHIASNALRNSKSWNSQSATFKFNNYIMNSLLAFDFLPKDACPVLLLITDGVFNLSELSYEIINHINQMDVSFGLVNISNIQTNNDFLYSYVPNIDLMESIVTCVDNGVYIDYDYLSRSLLETTDRLKTKNIQEALLLRNSPFFVSNDSDALLLTSNEGNVLSLLKAKDKTLQEIEMINYPLHMTNIESLLKIRTKQGFKVMDIKYVKNTDSITNFKTEYEKLEVKFVRLSYLFKRNIEIIYKLQIERSNNEMEEQSSYMSSGFGLSKLQRMNKAVISISVVMQKSIFEKFNLFIKKRAKTPQDSLFKSIHEFIQNVNIEDVLVEQYYNFAEKASSNKISIRKSDLTSINLEHSRELLFDIQSLLLRFSFDNNHVSSRAEPIVQTILSQLLPSKESTELTPTTPTSNPYSILKNGLEKNWSSFRINDELFIKFISEQECTYFLYNDIDDSELLTMEEKETCYSNGFCALNINYHSNSFLEITCRFFNVSSFTIRKMMDQLKQQFFSLFQHKGINTSFLNNCSLGKIIERLPKCKEDEVQYISSLFSVAPHYTSYLKHRNWVWPLGGKLNIAGILTAIFSQRLIESFNLVNAKTSTVFVKELEVKKRNNHTKDIQSTKFFILYCIHILKKEKKLITEVWIEPQTGCLQYKNFSNTDVSQFCADLCDHWFYNLDMQVISLFATFELIVSACKSGKGNINNIPTLNVEKTNLSTPFNFTGIYERSSKQDLLLKAYTHSQTEMNKESIKKNNLALYDRLMKLLIGINDIEILMEKNPLQFESKVRCFARIIETVGSERQKDFILTIVPAIISGDETEFKIVVCECTEDQLISPNMLKKNGDIQKIMCSQIQTHNSNKNISTLNDDRNSGVFNYLDFITNLHSYSYSYGVYKYLNQKVTLDRTNIISAIESCYEYREEIDLTEFFEAIMLARKYFFEKGENGEAPCSQMINSLKIIIEKYFEEIKETNYHYFLRESSIPRSQKPNTNVSLRKASIKSFDHLEEIESEDNYEMEENLSIHGDVNEIHDDTLSVSSALHSVNTTESLKEHSDSFSESSSSFTFIDSAHSSDLENASVPVFMRMEYVMTPNIKDQEDWHPITNYDENIIKLPMKELPIETISKTIMSSNGDVTKIFSSVSKVNKEESEEEEEDEEEESEEDEGMSTVSSYSDLQAPQNFIPNMTDLDWINSLNSVKTTLRLYAITLPPDKHASAFNEFEPSKKEILLMFKKHVTESQFAYAKSKFPRDDDESNSSDDISPTDEAAPYLDKNYLPKHIRTIISRTKKRIQALISKEILNALLNTSPITTYSIKKVYDNLEKLPQACYQKYSIPLHFMDQIEGIKLFHQELTKCKNLVFKRMEDQYIVYFRKRNCCQKHIAYEEFDKTCEHELSGEDNTTVNIFKREFDDLEMLMFDDDNEMERSCLEIPYWIIAKTENKKSLSILFYSPVTLTTKQANDVVSLLRKGVSVVCKRVNTLLLLSNLHDTRICSSLLLPPRDKDKKTSLSEISPLDKRFLRKDNDKSSDKFDEGTFACKKIHEITFPLHSRLTTTMAINHLNQAVFNPFIVVNRSEMFIYKERNGRVFYLQLVDACKNQEQKITSETKSPNSDTASQSSEQELDKTKLKEYSISLSSMGQYLYAELDIGRKVSAITLEVYGVYKPSNEITAQLRKLIEGKLSSLTMNIISNLLLRNRQFKLTIDDLDFIKPFIQRPHRTVFINIPKFVGNRLLLMLFIRNNLLTYMNQLYLSSPDDTTNDMTSTTSSLSFTEEEEDDGMMFKALEFSFLYNSVPQNTYSRTMTSAVVCKGISSVQMTLLNPDGELVTNFSKDKEPCVCDISNLLQMNLNVQSEIANIEYTDYGAAILKKEAEDSEDEENLKNYSDSYKSENGKLLLEVWKKGDVDVDSLLEKIVQTVNQSLTDYVLECGLLNTTIPLDGFNRLFLTKLQTLAFKSTRINSTTLLEHRASIFLPLWEMSRFIKDLNNLLSIYSFKINPETFISVDRNNFQLYNMNEDFVEKYHLSESTNVYFVLLGGNINVQVNESSTKNLEENAKLTDIIALEGFNYRNAFTYSRKCSIAIAVTSTEVHVITYNWKPVQFEKFKYHLHQSVSWLRCRVHLLNSILHQKLGLFYHSNSSNLVNVSISQQSKPQKEVQFAFNNIDYLIHNKQNAPVDPKPPILRSLSTQQMLPPNINQKVPTDARQLMNARFKTSLPPPLQTSISDNNQSQKLVLKKEKKTKQGKNQFGTLLKGIYDHDKVSNKSLTKQQGKDPLFIHGLHFKHIVHQNYKKKLEKQQISKIYNCWNKSHNHLKSKDFQLIKNTSRLIHFCRVPLLFNPLRRILFNDYHKNYSQQQIQHPLNFEMNEDNSMNLREISYHRKVFESFLSEYVEYIKSLDVTDVYLFRGDQYSPVTTTTTTTNTANNVTNNSPMMINNQQSSNDNNTTIKQPLVQLVSNNQIIKLHPTTIYFQKQMDEGVLFLELGLDSIYVYLNVYITEMESFKPTSYYQRSFRGEFLKKVSLFKHSLHMNSFSYDFHLRNFFSYLTTDYSGYPSSLSFMNLLKDFSQFYPRPPPHTRNVLHSHQIIFENVKDIAEILREKVLLPNISKEKMNNVDNNMLQDPFHFFFDYICNNYDKYHVKFSQKSKDCFILDTYISHDEADYSYCVLVSKSNNDEMNIENEMNLIMYIIFVDNTNRHPYDSEVEGSKEQLIRAITRMAQQYERKLKNLIQSVKNSFKLEILWEMALRFKMSEYLFNELDTLWIKTSIQEYDHSLQIFDANYVPWNDVVSELWNIYGSESVGSIFKKDGSGQHLLVICCEDTLLHIHFNILENTIKTYLCRKKLKYEPESAELKFSATPPTRPVDVFDPNALTEMESNFITEFVNNICFILYRLIK
ncbi:hypothetical protein ABK040_008808 [Willaertia magna]